MIYGMEKIRLVIFDMDGLILDSETVYVYSAGKALELMGYHNDKSFIIDTLGIGWDVSRKIYERNCPGIDHEKFRDKLHEVEDEYLEGHPFEKKKGLMELLKYLKENDIYTAVATSTHRLTAEKRLSDAGVLECFDCIICGDDIVEGKPSPQIYLKVLERMNIEAKNALVLEDSMNGLLSANNAGIECIVVPDICIIPDDILEKAYAVAEDLGCVIDIVRKNNMNEQ